jgi:predicted protein tyrosine phosphatase
MIQVHPSLWIGSAADYESKVITGNALDRAGWAVVQAAKDPYHRAALGYTTRNAPKSNPEHLVAQRGNRLILNMIDAAYPAAFNAGAIHQALSFTAKSLATGLTVLIHCNQGRSRSPSLAMLYLHATTAAYDSLSFQQAESRFMATYRAYAPAAGIRTFVANHWVTDRIGAT